jgi:CheY-like chemotaxis protein
MVNVPNREAPALRILVVEDNADGREMMRVLLELLGHEVLVAADGQDGVEKALGWHPDVAVVDIGLPRLNGYEVARRLRRELGCELFLITQTGYGRPEDREQALAAGFDVHLTKPVDPVELVGWLEKAGQRTVERKRVRASTNSAKLKASAG